MEFDQIIKLINTVSDSKVTHFSIEEGDTRISIKKAEKEAKTSFVQMQAPAVNMLPVQEFSQVVETKTTVNVAEDANLLVVKSPLVGTFYAASSPEVENFVKIGDKVKKGQVIGIIEAMKLMNDIESDFDGEIVEILVNNQDMVEYGQPLFKIK
jgi:acetyl-CoA carboxylase biotin carboxyl carrier protein